MKRIKLIIDVNIYCKQIRLSSSTTSIHRSKFSGKLLPQQEIELSTSFLAIISRVLHPNFLAHHPPPPPAAARRFAAILNKNGSSQLCRSTFQSYPAYIFPQALQGPLYLPSPRTRMSFGIWPGIYLI
jgi:hypothetical protein